MEKRLDITWPYWSKPAAIGLLFQFVQTQTELILHLISQIKYFGIEMDNVCISTNLKVFQRSPSLRFIYQVKIISKSPILSLFVWDKTPINLCDAVARYKQVQKQDWCSWSCCPESLVFNTFSGDPNSNFLTSTKTQPNKKNKMKRNKASLLT